jgi:hypothetical protein
MGLFILISISLIGLGIIGFLGLVTYHFIFNML